MKLRKKQRFSHSVLQNKLCFENEFSAYLIEIKPDSFTETTKLICDMTAKKIYDSF